MLSSSALKYSIHTTPSFVAKRLVMMVVIASVIALMSLWGVSWFTGVFLIIYVAAFGYLASSLRMLPFSCLISDSGEIEVNQPNHLTGSISSRSFYNGWVLFLCIEVTDNLMVGGEQLHNKPKRWFVVFNDSVAEADYRLLARVIKNAPRA